MCEKHASVIKGLDNLKNVDMRKQCHNCVKMELSKCVEQALLNAESV